jgi:hypothetical protein
MTQSWRSDAAGLDSAGLIDANGSRNDTLPLSVNDRAFIKLAAIRVCCALMSCPRSEN